MFAGAICAGFAGPGRGNAEKRRFGLLEAVGRSDNRDEFPLDVMETPMRRWKLVTVLVLGVLWMLACEEQARTSVEGPADDSPVAGVWYLQSVGEAKPVAGDVDIRFEFLGDGAAFYERSTQGSGVPGGGPLGPEGPVRFDMRYNLSGEIISIDSNSDDPGVPRITGRIELADDGQTLEIQTHNDERWVMTRLARPGGAIEAARQVEQLQSRADPMLVRVQHLAYAVGRYEQRFGELPGGLLDLVDAGLVSPGMLTASGSEEDLPARYSRMTDTEKSAWLGGHSVFALVEASSAEGNGPRVVVTSLPRGNRDTVTVGLSNGSVHRKTAEQAAKLMHQQGGELPGRWPSPGLSADAAAGVQPLSD